MATFVLTDGRLLLNGFDLSSHTQSVTLELTAGDVIIVNSGGSNGVVDIIIITTSSATQVRSALLA